jgi:hypothetical protein
VVQAEVAATVAFFKGATAQLSNFLNANQGTNASTP